VHSAGIWFVSGTYSSYLFDFYVLQALVSWCECRCLLLYTVGKINSTVNDMVHINVYYATSKHNVKA